MNIVGLVLVSILGTVTVMTAYRTRTEPDPMIARRLGTATAGLAIATLGVAIMFTFLNE